MTKKMIQAASHELAGILTDLENFMDDNCDLVAVQATATNVWSDGIKAIIQPDGVLCVDKDYALEAGLTPETLGLLKQAGLLAAHNGSRVRLNGSRRPVHAIDLPNMQQKIKETAVGGAETVALKREMVGLRKAVQLLSAESDLHQKVDLFYDSLMQETKKLLGAQKKIKAPAPRFADPRRSEKKLAGVPTLFLSDWHFDEVVDPRQIEGKNEYNHDIAVARAEQLFETAGKLLFTHMSGAYYDGIVVALGGDMLSGMIHDELRRTNDRHLNDSIMALAGLLAVHIRRLASEFVDVYIPCVVGNHGRMDKKPQMKGYVKDNYDYMVYIILKALLADCPNVQVDVSESTDIRYKIYGWRYRMTHGNQAKGGSGVGGFWPSLAKLDMRKRKLEGDFDYLILGHFHQRGRMSNMLVNGSLKGYDEYALFSAFDYQPAEQSLWITHPDHGITFEMPIIVQEPRYERRFGSPITPTASATGELPEGIN